MNALLSRMCSLAPQHYFDSSACRLAKDQLTPDLI